MVTDVLSLIVFGDIGLMKESMKNKSFCIQNDKNFNYHGIKNALSGKTRINNENGQSFTPKRILVIQMK